MIRQANALQCGAAGLLLLLASCGSPNPANIELRKQNQQLQGRLDTLEKLRAADVAQLADRPTVPTLPPTRLDKLFTVHALSLGRLTGVADGQLKVYVVPTDEDGDPIKAAGSFKVSAFDLTDSKHPTVGTWSFDGAETRTLFYSKLSLYTYVLSCPLPASVPKKLTVHVTFDDALTGRQFSADRDTGG